MRTEALSRVWSSWRSKAVGPLWCSLTGLVPVAILDFSRSCVTMGLGLAGLPDSGVGAAGVAGVADVGYVRRNTI